MEELLSPTQKRIAIVVRSLWASTGIAKVAIGEAISFVQLGYIVDLIFLRRLNGWNLYGHLLDMAKQAGVNVTVLSDGSGQNGKRFRKSFNYWITRPFSPLPNSDAAIDLISIIKCFFFLVKRDYHFVLFQDQFIAINGLLIRFLHKKGYYVYLHDAIGGHFASGIANFFRIHLVEGPVLAHANSVFTNSKVTSDSIKGIVPPERITIAYLGSAFQLRSDLNTNRYARNRNIILVLTTWEAGRSPEWYLEVARHLTIAKLLMVGKWKDSVLEASVKSLSKRFPYEGKVNIGGEVPEQDIEKYYQISSLYLRVGNSERGPGQGVMEALSCGLPVVVNSGLGSAEIVHKYDCGLVLRGENASDMNPRNVAQLLESLLIDDSTLQRFSDNCLNAAKEFSVKNHSSLIVKSMERWG